MKKMAAQSNLPEIKNEALDLLEKLLCFDPKKRFTAIQCAEVGGLVVWLSYVSVKTYTKILVGFKSWKGTRAFQRCSPGRIAGWIVGGDGVHSGLSSGVRFWRVSILDSRLESDFWWRRYWGLAAVGANSAEFC